jgi:chaperonin GroES
MQNKFTKYEPLYEKVLIEPIVKRDQQTDGGLYIPDTIRKDVSEGTVRAVGPGFHARDTGVFIQTVLHEGEVVLFGSNSGISITLDGIEMKLISESDVLMIIGDEKLDN